MISSHTFGIQLPSSLNNAQSTKHGVLLCSVLLSLRPSASRQRHKACIFHMVSVLSHLTSGGNRTEEFQASAASARCPNTTSRPRNPHPVLLEGKPGALQSCETCCESQVETRSFLRLERRPKVPFPYQYLPADNLNTRSFCEPRFLGT